jgi:hypothetical protein
MIVAATCWSCTAEPGPSVPVEERVRRRPFAGDERVLALLYQKSYMNSRPFGSRSHRSAIEKSGASSTAKPPGVLRSASPCIEIVTMSPGMQWTMCGALRPSLSVISSQSMMFLIRGLRGSQMSMMCRRESAFPNDHRVALELRMACRRARVPAEMVQFVADARHLGGDLRDLLRGCARGSSGVA